MLKNPVSNYQPTGLFYGYLPGHCLFGDNNQLIVLDSDEREKLWKQLNMSAREQFKVHADELKNLKGVYYPYGSLFA